MGASEFNLADVNYLPTKQFSNKNAAEVEEFKRTITTERNKRPRRKTIG